MSELSHQNAALRASRALKDFIGRLGLSTTDTAEFEAVADDDFEVPQATVAYGVFGPAEYRTRRGRRRLTRAQVEDRAAVSAALEAEGFPEGQVPSIFSTPEPE